MTLKHNRNLTKRAQELRRNATPQEKHLWYDFLSTYPMRFRRQVTIDRFIVDFYCAGAKLVVELDGSQHYTADAMIYDEERTAILQGYGIEVLRLSNREVNAEFAAVCRHIHNVVKDRTGSDPYYKL